jgi:2-oxoisovalerate dehydrogenase E2 component (dihydrolipoyl transacylase)
MGIRIVKLPDVGEGVAEAELVEWHVTVGQSVLEDQVLAAVMTDKATVEIPSPVSGTVVALGAEVGGVLAVGAELVRLEVAGEGSTDVEAATKQAAAAAPQAVAPVAAVAASAPRPAPPPPRLPAQQGATGNRPLASPAVRRRARDAGVDLRQVRGSGPAGRIGHDDLDAFLRGPRGTGQGRARRQDWDHRRQGRRAAPSYRREDGAVEVAHPAHHDCRREVDVSALEDLRAALNKKPTAERPKLTILPFLMRGDGQGARRAAQSQRAL